MIYFLLSSLSITTSLHTSEHSSKNSNDGNDDDDDDDDDDNTNSACFAVAKLQNVAEGFVLSVRPARQIFAK
jgi:hypothetical protein